MSKNDELRKLAYQIELGESPYLQLAEVLGWKRVDTMPDKWRADDRTPYPELPFWLDSVDDAMTLMPADRTVYSIMQRDTNWTVTLSKFEDQPEEVGGSTSLSRAWVAAALRAKAATI